MNPEFRSTIYSLDPVALGVNHVLGEEQNEGKQPKVVDTAGAAAASQQPGKSTPLQGAAAASGTKSNKKGGKRGGGNGKDGRPSTSSSAAASTSVQADASIVSQLVEMGFTVGGSKRACVLTSNKGFDAAMNEYFSHGDAAAEPAFHKDDDGYDGGGGKKDGGGGGKADDEEEEEGSGKGKGGSGEADGDDGGGVGGGEDGKRKKSKMRVIPVALELQRLFARLQLAKRASVDTKHLTTRGFSFKPGDEKVRGRRGRGGFRFLLLLLLGIFFSMRISTAVCAFQGATRRPGAHHAASRQTGRRGCQVFRGSSSSSSSSRQST
jgi:hypothetical protein